MEKISIFSKYISVFYMFLISFCIFAQNNTGQISIEPKLGGKYNILQYRANIREKPSRYSDVVAILSLNDEIEILENSQIQEKINNVWGYWYKIKYGNIIGYTFGGNIALVSFITDIDKNGIDDYFYFRVANNERWQKEVGINWQSYALGWRNLEKASDIIIYINNQLIDTSKVVGRAFIHPFDRLYDFCKFEEYEDSVLIKIIDYGSDNTAGYEWEAVYKISGNGGIEFFESTSSYNSVISTKRDKHGNAWLTSDGGKTWRKDEYANGD